MWNFLDQIEAVEDSKNVDTNDRIWLYFDIKRGLTKETFAKLSHEEKEWIRSKLLLIELTPDSTEIPGLGDRITSVLIHSPGGLGRIAHEVRRDSWLSIFGSFIDNLLWFFLSTARIIT
jgi:hypothetical protein